MIVPQYWAEARAQERSGAKQITLRRFGWSSSSQADAQRHAEQRVNEAMRRALAGEELPQRERKVGYGGPDGLPIREEIVEVYGETVITRNAYGARCLNTANVCFIDIDRADQNPAVGCWMQLVLMILVPAISFSVFPTRLATTIMVAIWISTFAVVYLIDLFRSRNYDSNWEEEALERIREFVEQRPDWLVRVYRTPAGYRLLVKHRLFDPLEEELAEAFTALQADQQYVWMCQSQRCFRARVSPKPWRIGIDDHLRPRPGVWPIAPDKLPERQAWVERYEARAANYAACEYVTELGSGSAHYTATAVQQLHDRLCRATEQLELA